MDAYLNTAFFFFSLVLFEHDRQVLQEAVAAGEVDGYELVDDEIVATGRGSVSIFEDEDFFNDELDVSSFENGISVDEQNRVLTKVRHISDILSNSVAQLRDDPEVMKWLEDEILRKRVTEDELKGLTKEQLQVMAYRIFQEDLVGSYYDVPGKQVLEWYQNARLACRSMLGYEPTPVGEPMMDPIEGATGYTSYAVTVHRELVNQKAYGLLPDPEETSTVNWDSMWMDLDSSDVPGWWSRVSIGRFRRGSYKHSGQLRQTETSLGAIWMVDIRVSKDGIGVGRFAHISTYKGGYSVMLEHPSVVELIRRFYNEPRRLTWVKVGREPKARWAAGMQTPSGNWMWCTTTWKSSNLIDWHRENDDKPYEAKLRRAIYLGEWIITYRKAREQDIFDLVCQKFLESEEWKAPWKEAFYDLVDTGAYMSFEDKLEQSPAYRDSVLRAVFSEFKREAPERFEELKNSIYVEKLKASEQNGMLARWNKKVCSPSEWGKIKRDLLKRGGKDAYLGKPWKLYEKPKPKDEHDQQEWEVI